ncbi:MAG: outer membrane protein assembly factor BamE [Proteobacteria bacterium]|jgi:outer membrane protein assembly factor BamE (lipoprotein component of BamABCDE complex)|nr:outer membrane protein assembly factor BamE [Pseudomonadota bacterium]
MGRNLFLIASGFRKLSFLLVCVFAVSCSQIIKSHGYIPLESDINKIVVGKDTRDVVQKLIGVPSTTGVLGDDSWYYIASKFRYFGWKDREEISREIVAITFSKSNIVKNIERYDLSDGEVVTISRRVTTKTVKDRVLLRQISENFGKVNLPGAVSDQFGD